MGIGMDSSITPLPSYGLSLVQTTDFFYPLVEDPYIMDLAREAGTQVTGGQTVKNPWLTIGGVATTVCSPKDIIMPTGAQVGDILMLTKPLGTHYAVKAYRWLHQQQQPNQQQQQQQEKQDEIVKVLSREHIEGVYRKAAISMATLNINGGLLIAMGREDCVKFSQEMQMVGEKVFMIGSVKEGDGIASLVKNPRYIEVAYT